MWAGDGIVVDPGVSRVNEHGWGTTHCVFGCVKSCVDCVSCTIIIGIPCRESEHPHACMESDLDRHGPINLTCSTLCCAAVAGCACVGFGIHTVSRASHVLYAGQGVCNFCLKVKALTRTVTCARKQPTSRRDVF